MNQPKKSSSESSSEKQPPQKRIHRPKRKRKVDQKDSSSDEEFPSHPRKLGLPTTPQSSKVRSLRGASPLDIAKEWEFYTHPFNSGNPFRTVHPGEVRELTHLVHSDECSSEVDEPAVTPHETSESNLDDLAYFEFSELQLKLKSPLMSPKPGEKDGAPGSELSSPGDILANSQELSNREAATAFSINGGQDKFTGSSFEPPLIDSDHQRANTAQGVTSINFQEQDTRHTSVDGSPSTRAVNSNYHPVGLDESLHQLPALLQPQEMYQPNSLSHQSTHEPHKLFTNFGKPQNRRPADWEKTSPIYCELISSQPALPMQPTVQCEPVKLFYNANTAHSPLTLRETAPPNEVILQPMALPQLTVPHPGSSVSGLPKVKFLQHEWTESPYLASTSEAGIQHLPPPPSYSECMQDKQKPDQILPFTYTSWESDRPTYDQTSSLLYDNASQWDRHSCHPADGKAVTDVRRPLFVNGAINFTQTALECGVQSDDQSESLGVRGRPRWEPPPGDHQLLAFISCLFCWPIGLVAIYYSNMSHMLKAEGNYEQARTYARLAFIASLIGLCSGSFAYVVMLIYEKA